jgi:hypothetical protein
MTHGKPLDVLVHPAHAMRERPRLFAALEQLFPVRFRAGDPGRAPSALVDIADGASREPAASVSWIVQPPCIEFRVGVVTTISGQRVRFSDDVGIDRRLRGVELADQQTGEPLHGEGAFRTLATMRDGVSWASFGESAVPQQRVAGALPELTGGQTLRDALYGVHGLSIVALVQFLRDQCKPIDFRSPPLRATILFDDPNLRRRTYGFIDYRRLVEHADAHGYHAVMAMIPRDGRAAHSQTVELFARRADRLSIAFHGNDHVKRELLTTDYQAALRLSAQALTRVARFERRTGLHVDRVMTPPHGMCSEPVVRALAALRFDALSAIHPQPWSGQPPADHLLSGWGPATFAGPLAVLTRFPLTFPATDVALRAFMDGPLVFYGHHGDLATGLDLLEQAAARANRLGEVEWMSLGGIAASNYGVWTGDGTTVIRPYSGHMKVSITSTPKTIEVEEPGVPASGLGGWSVGNGPVLGFETTAGSHADEVEVRLRSKDEVDPASVRVLAPRPAAAARRTATELRDRGMGARARIRWT